MGSYGKVYSCINTTNGKTLAVKIILRSKFKDQTTAGIQQELDVMKKMRHKHIIKIYEIIDDPTSKKVYIIMKLC